MHVLETIISWYAPHACLGCGREGAVLCADCITTLPAAETGCYRCRKPTRDGRSCLECRPNGLDAVRAATRYSGPAKDVVWRLKFERARSAADRMSLAMAVVCSRDPQVVITPVPTAPSRIRPRGYDQAVLLARAIAKRNGLTYIPLLMRLGRQRQVGANRAQRQLQMRDAFQLRSERARQRVRGAHVILVDDVITTGATLESAARTLRTAGARSVEAVVFAQAPQHITE